MIFFFFVIIALFSCNVCNSLDDDEVYSPYEVKTEFGVLTSDQFLNHSSDVKLDPAQWKYTTQSGYHIGVYNNLLALHHLKMLRALLTYKAGSWSYRIAEDNVKGGQEYLSLNDIPWYNELDSFKFSTTIVGKELQALVAKFVGLDSVQYYPYQVVGHILRRGDFTKVHIDADAEDDEITMMIYLNPKWRKNDYGDLYLYDDDQEILAGIVPHYGRIVVWQSSIPYLPRPPSVAFKPGQLFLHISFTKNKTKVQDTHSKWNKKQEFDLNIRTNGFLTQFKHDTPITAQSHLVSEAKSKNGKRIVVFDGLFSRDDLDELRRVILNYGVYFYDDSYDEESDNVQWIAGFDIDDYVKSSMWKVTQQVAAFVSGGQSEWFPYDVSCNLIRNADTTQIHHDCAPNENEWTFLLYLNPEWTINHYGETVFYERNEDDTEIITEVLPKYGRVVIFEGVLPHSARPPSTNFSGARLSFAVKLSESEWSGRRKAFQEVFRHLTAARTIFNVFKRKFLSGDDDDEGHHEEHDDSNERPPLDDEFNEESFTVDPEEQESDDPKLEEMKTKLETIMTTYDPDIEDLRSLTKEVQHEYLKTTDDIGNIIYQFL